MRSCAGPRSNRCVTPPPPIPASGPRSISTATTGELAVSKPGGRAAPHRFATRREVRLEAPVAVALQGVLRAGSALAHWGRGDDRGVGNIVRADDLGCRERGGYERGHGFTAQEQSSRGMFSHREALLLLRGGRFVTFGGPR